MYYNASGIPEGCTTATDRIRFVLYLEVYMPQVIEGLKLKAARLPSGLSLTGTQMVKVPEGFNPEKHWKKFVQHKGIRGCHITPDFSRIRNLSNAHLMMVVVEGDIFLEPLVEPGWQHIDVGCFGLSLGVDIVPVGHWTAVEFRDQKAVCVCPYHNRSFATTLQEVGEGGEMCLPTKHHLLAYRLIV